MESEGIGIGVDGVDESLKESLQESDFHFGAQRAGRSGRASRRLPPNEHQRRPSQTSHLRRGRAIQRGRT